MTILEHLSTLPAPYRTEIFEEIAKQKTEGRLTEIVDTTDAAVDRAIAWDKSKKGGIYWLNLYRGIRDGEIICKYSDFIDEVTLEFTL